MAEARRYRNKQNGHIVGPLTATEAKEGIADLASDWEVEGDDPETWGETTGSAAKPKRAGKRKPASDASTPAEGAGSGDAVDGNSAEGAGDS